MRRIARRDFTVRSSPPDWRWAVIHLTVATLVALGYGVAVFVIVNLGTAIPNTPANVGSYQFFTVLGLTLFGVDKTSATGFSLVVFSLLTLPPLVIGFLALSRSGLSLATIREELRRPERRANLQSTVG
jgi:hypothetical protein